MKNIRFVYIRISFYHLYQHESKIILINIQIFPGDIPFIRLHKVLRTPSNSSSFNLFTPSPLVSRPIPRRSAFRTTVRPNHGGRKGEMDNEVRWKKKRAGVVSAGSADPRFLSPQLTARASNMADKTGSPHEGLS